MLYSSQRNVDLLLYVLQDYHRIIYSIEKYDRRIQELDLSLMNILRQRLRDVWKESLFGTIL